MQQSVLSLGEKLVTAARLAAIEHVRQEMAELSMKETSVPATLARAIETKDAPRGFVRRGLDRFKIRRTQEAS